MEHKTMDELLDAWMKENPPFDNDAQTFAIWLCSGKLRAGDQVVKNPLNWKENAFDSWGRGVGVGTIVEIVDGDVDVKWPAGKCFENPIELTKV